MIFNDRLDAARQLANALSQYQGQNPLVLAIPRGGVPMGKLISDQLGGDFDVVLVRKLRAPHSPETAVGSIDEGGNVFLAAYAELAGADEDYLAREKQFQMDVIRKRRAQYSVVHRPISAAGRIVIVVDDGLATGATMISALTSLRHHHPSKLICAVPVASTSSYESIQEIADELVCLDVPEYFGAVGQFYRLFPQVEDEEVIQLLSNASKI
jgi:predicted phosphoribosyltransferase